MQIIDDLNKLLEMYEENETILTSLRSEICMDCDLCRNVNLSIDYKGLNIKTQDKKDYNILKNWFIENIHKFNIKPISVVCDEDTLMIYIKNVVGDEETEQL